MATAEITSASGQVLPAFRNEPLVDFSQPQNRDNYLAALAKVRGQLGREYLNHIGTVRAAASQKFTSDNPSRIGEVVGLHQESSAATAREAITEAERVFQHLWRWSKPEDRVEVLLKAAKIIRQRKTEFSAWLTFEVGKTFPEADADVAETIDFLEYYSRLALKLAEPPALLQMPGEHDEMRYIPLGVGAVIPPWNFAMAIMAGMTGAAIVAGNTVVLKPSSDSPTIAALFVQVLEEAGLPPGVVNLVTGGGNIVGNALVEDPRVRFIAFTGSKTVGLEIHEKAARTPRGQMWIKRTLLEMGGKDSILVNDDADLDAAVSGVVASAFGFQGQKCSACSRAIVHAAVYDRFVEAVAAAARQLKVGDAADPANALGPVINQRAMNKIQEYFAVGRREGRLLAGGEAVGGTGFFLPATVFADVAPDAQLAQEEIFGPVLAIIKCRDFEHGLEIANNTEYGLTGAVYTNSSDRLEQAREQFHVGNLYLNRKCTGAMVGAHPFGGFNMSGTDSKAGGPDYLLLFTQAKSIAQRL